MRRSIPGEKPTINQRLDDKEGFGQTAIISHVVDVDVLAGGAVRILVQKYRLTGGRMTALGEPVWESRTAPS